MTCIVGVLTREGVVIGADSIGIGEYNYTVRKDKKVFSVGEIIFGFAGSFRVGQLLEYSLCLPPINVGQGEDNYIHTSFINAVRDCFKAGGCTQLKESVEKIDNGVFLVGYSSKLYAVLDDYQVVKPSLPYFAIGCGSSQAEGALFQMFGDRMPDNIAEATCGIVNSIKAAEAFCVAVRGPYNLISLSPEGLVSEWQIS